MPTQAPSDTSQTPGCISMTIKGGTAVLVLVVAAGALLAGAAEAGDVAPGRRVPRGAPHSVHAPHLRARRAEDHVEHADRAADNEAEATDLDEQPAQDAQYQQQYQDNQEAQEARHYNRRAQDDNYEDEQDIVYDFSYEVKDPHTGNDFGHRQSRSGGLTQGQYRVLLPDGRMQVVDYVSDRDGFRPNIRYEDVGIPVFAGSEQHEQFADGTNHFDQEHASNSVAPSGGLEGAQGPSPDEVRRRRRRDAGHH